MRSIFLICFALILSPLSFAAESCEGLLTVLPSKKLNRNVLHFGDQVLVRLANGENRKAYLLGVSDGRAYFVPTESTPLTRPLFYIPVTDLNFQVETELSPGTALVDSLGVNAAIPEIYATESRDACAPQSVMACLAHLDRMGLLPGHAKAELSSNHRQLFEEMFKIFSREAISDTDESKTLWDALQVAPDSKTQKKIVEKMRMNQFGRISKTLEDFGVKTEITSSYSRLIKHLKKGKPAYISVSATHVGVAQPHVEDWDLSLPWDHKDIRVGTIPVPVWAPSSGGFHAVYALGVLPKATGVGGFFLGHRIVILDPEGGRLNVWNTFLLRVSNSARFILIGI